jgi:hypothetical protein
VVVAVAVVLMVQMPVDQVVDVVAMRDRLVTAVRPVDVVGGMAGARVARAAAVRMALVDAEDVIVQVIAVRVTQTPVLDEVDVSLVDDGDVAAAGAVDVLGAVAAGRHLSAERSDQRPTGCRTRNPRFERRAACQREPASR